MAFQKITHQKKFGVSARIAGGDILTDSNGRPLTVYERFNRGYDDENNISMRTRTAEFLNKSSTSAGACVGFACGHSVETFGKNGKGQWIRYRAVETGISTSPFSIDASGSKSQ